MAFFKKDTIEEKNKQLLENENRFRDIFEQSAVGESIVDLDGHWLDANKRLCEITGYSKEELLGKHFIDITHPDDIELSKECREDVHSGKKPVGVIEKRYIKKNGDIVWVLLGISLHRDENKNPEYFIVHTQDISKLKEAEERYRVIVEEGNDGIVIVQDYLSKFVNKRMQKLIGYNLDKIQGMPFLNFIDPDSVDLVKQNYEKRIAGEQVGKNYQIKVITKDGQKIIVEISGSLINYEGKPADMVFVRDVTDENMEKAKDAEYIEQIKKINELTVGRELRMAELKKEINELKNKLAEK